MTTTTYTAHAAPSSASWSGVFAMTLCIFALIASEFMPVSLLTPMAADLHISEGLAGQGIAISGAFAVLTSLCISSITAGMDRKRVLLVLTGLMAVSGAIVGLAANYAAYMTGRALIGAVIGGFWSMSAATAMRLVPPAQVARAFAIFNGGNALAAIVAAPLGSYLGSIIGWRGAFLGLVPVAAITLAWQWMSLPAMPARERASRIRDVFALLGNPVVAWGMAGCSVFFMGQFALFTYVRPFLETVAKVDAAGLSLVLLATGLAGFVGTTLIGRFLNRSLFRTLIAIPLVMASIALALTVWGGSLGAVFALMMLWGLVATAAPVGWWKWLAQTLPRKAEAGGGLMVAVVQLAIALGSTLGGALFDTSGYRSAFILSAGLLLVASALAFAASRATVGSPR